MENKGKMWYQYLSNGQKTMSFKIVHIEQLNQISERKLLSEKPSRYTISDIFNISI